MDAPTRLLGMVDDSQYGTLVHDVYEHIPDLFYPMSVEIFGQMRRDPRLTAVLDGYGLQLRRAQWQLDGAGCRPEVVSLVADCLGLNVAGKDRPSGARRRGVSWNDHLRAALLSEVWGHYPFEILAEVNGGRARLVALAERTPGTISQIHANAASGALLGIDQRLVTGRDKGPQIPADRLVFYSRAREGAAWQGTSLIRAAYPAWLLKREMQRVSAISHRRWGAGVPVAQALPGTNPTPGQMEEAQRMAAAARAGDVAGAAMPPGFNLQIQGLSGSIPDTLGFIRYLNQEIAQSVLMPHIDLGTTATGSRALGDSFVDSWTLALEAEAEAVADTITRQCVARIVEWNWGEDEPVPVVTVAGIGSRREVTAASLQQLLSAGALSADPGLEAWVRREYRLPEREEPPARQPLHRAGPKPAEQQPADDAGPDQPDQSGDGEQPPADAAPPRKPRRKVNASPGQLDLFAAAPEPGEPDYTAIDQQWQQAVDDLTAQWEQAAEPAVTEIVAAVAAAGGLAALTALVASGGIVLSGAALAAMSGPIGAALLAIAAASAEDVTAEALAAGVKAKRGRPDTDALRSRAEAVAQVIAQGYVQGASRVVLAEAGGTATPEQVADVVERHLDDMTATAAGEGRRGWVAGQLAEALTAAQAEGRNATYEANATRVVGFRASEVNDKNRCGPCSEIDGKTYPDREASLVDYPVAGFRSCDGRARCRGILRAIWG